MLNGAFTEFLPMWNTWTHLRAAKKCNYCRECHFVAASFAMWSDSVCVVLPLWTVRSSYACVCACKSLDQHPFNTFDTNKYRLNFTSANPDNIISFPYFSDRGFINLTPSEINETIHVRSGESLTLSVDMEAYPKPHTFSWGFMGHELRNTTDHVITTHSHEYRWDDTQAHIHALRVRVLPHRWKCSLPPSSGI